MKKTIGKRIREIREGKGFTQEAVASALEISRQKLARMEKGENDISYDAILKLASFFDVDPIEITKVVETETHEAFRLGGSTGGNFSQIEDIIDMFFANKSLYTRMNAGENND